MYDFYLKFIFDINYFQFFPFLRKQTFKYLKYYELLHKVKFTPYLVLYHISKGMYQITNNPVYLPCNSHRTCFVMLGNTWYLCYKVWFFSYILVFSWLLLCFSEVLAKFRFPSQNCSPLKELISAIRTEIHKGT